MESKELREYIQSQINNKIPKEEIIKILKEQGGWGDKDINDVFSSLEQSVRNQNPTVKKPGKKIEQPEIQQETFDKKTSNHGLQIIVAIVVLAIISVGGYFGVKHFSESTDLDGSATEEVEDNGTVEELVSGVEIRKDGVYYMDELIEGADIKTFEIIGENDDGFLYAKDSAMVYRLDFFETLSQPEIGKLSNKDPETFVLLGEGLSKDKNNFYYQGVNVPDGDLDSFVCVGEAKRFSVVNKGQGMYCKDKNKVYCLDRQEAQILNHLDAESFEMVGKNGQYPRFFVDKNAVYTPRYCGLDGIEILQNIDPVTFKEKIQFIGTYFSPITYEETMPNLKMLNLNVLLYAKDSERVYCGEEGSPTTFNTMGNVLTEADSQTFEPLLVSKEGIIKYAKDKNAIYLGCERFDFLDTDSFEILEEEYVRDKNAYYYKKLDRFHKIEGVNFDTFVIVNGKISKDKNHVYYENRTLGDADPDTFEALNEDYAKDKNNVYNYGEIIEGANPVNCTVENLDGCKAPTE